MEIDDLGPIPVEDIRADVDRAGARRNPDNNLHEATLKVLGIVTASAPHQGLSNLTPRTSTADAVRPF